MSESCSQSENFSEEDQQCKRGSKRKQDVMHDALEAVSTSEEDDTSSETNHSSAGGWPAALLKEEQPIDDVFELKPNSEEDEISSKATQQEQITTMEGFKQLQSPPTTKVQKESIHAEVTEISKSRYQQAKKEANNKFAKIFTFDDEKTILRALHKHDYKSGSTEFWSRVGESLKLSTSVSQLQVYKKVRRLQQKYDRNSRAQNRYRAMSQDEAKLYRLSEKIWGKKKKSLQKTTEEDCEKKPAVLVDETKEVGGDNKQNLEKFVAALRKQNVYFPVAEALSLVPAWKRSKLEDKWKELDLGMLQLYNRRIDLIQETIRGVVSSSSFLS
ncbi:hypothetical protein L2E82_24310 [Cichorium intybus]|uniref:Uncharacterized protein n=1 Tax=Cichorium intybus TaxID=13427 RepID=A0ACB9E012_CICIN|nr:hypothetical protein L2E82_24310 [Cichorium intybus]